MNNRLDENFYKKDALILAKELLGKLIVRKLDDGTIIRARITETESYFGEEDTACHASKGRTPRTSVMYEEGGRAYIYLCYGMHYLFNVVTGSKDHPEAVLIRSIEGYNGPAKLTKYLNITKELNNEDIITSDKLWIEDDNYKAKYISTPRVGIAYATKKYRDIKWRHILK